MINKEWKYERITEPAIKSSLGGDCRIRSYSPLKAEGDGTLVQAKGENTNPFYQLPQIKKPLISPEAKLQAFELKKTFLYDIKTKPGETYTFVSE